MQLTPQNFHKKYSKKTCVQKNHILHFGVSGLKVLESVRLTETQIKTFEWVIKKILKNQKTGVKFWSKFNLNLTLTKLSLESRMGKGKGNFEARAQFLKPGTVFFEFSELSHQLQKKISNNLIKIFPVKIKFIK